MENRCAYCGEAMAAKAAFCSHCGTPAGALAPLKNPTETLEAPKVRRGSSSWEEMKYLLGFYSILLTCSLVFGLAGWAHLGPKGDIVETIIWDSVVVAFLIHNWKGVARVFRFRKPRTRKTLELLAACVMVYFFLQGYFAVMEYFHWPFIQLTADYTKAGWPLWGILAMISLEPGVFEEIAFRGIIQTKLSRVLSVREALVLQAALFSILHLSPIIFVSHFVMGLLLGWVRLRTGHLYFGMLLHMGWNAMVALKELGY